MYKASRENVLQYNVANTIHGYLNDVYHIWHCGSRQLGREVQQTGTNKGKGPCLLTLKEESIWTAATLHKIQLHQAIITCTGSRVLIIQYFLLNRVSIPTITLVNRESTVLHQEKKIFHNTVQASVRAGNISNKAVQKEIKLLIDHVYNFSIFCVQYFKIKILIYFCWFSCYAVTILVLYNVVCLQFSSIYRNQNSSAPIGPRNMTNINLFNKKHRTKQ